MNNSVQILNAEQLQHLDYVEKVLDQWYAGRRRPEFINDLFSRPKSYYHVKQVGGTGAAAGATRHDFFDANQSGDIFNSNFKTAVAPGDKVYIIGGIQLLEAVGATATDEEDDLDFGLPAQGEVLSGTFSLEVNRDIIFEDEPIDSNIINSENIPGFFRLPKPIIWEPDNSIKLTISLAGAFGSTTYIYLKPVLKGIELAK